MPDAGLLGAAGAPLWFSHHPPRLPGSASGHRVGRGQGSGEAAVDPEASLTAAAAYAAVARVLPPAGVVVCESVSTMRDCQDQIRVSRPGAFYSPAGASLGFGVPAALGVQVEQALRTALGDPRPHLIEIPIDGSGDTHW